MPRTEEPKLRPGWVRPGGRNKPKSRNGCARCKARRLKCDETSPACQRCVKADEACQYPRTSSASASGIDGRGRQHGGGYRDIRPAAGRSTPTPTTATAQSIHHNNSFLLPSPSPSALHLSTVAHLFTTPSETLFFDLFRARIAPALVAHGHSAEFWGRTVPRESSRDPSVRHCLVAIGALDRAGRRHAEMRMRRPLFVLRTGDGGGRGVGGAAGGGGKEAAAAAGMTVWGEEEREAERGGVMADYLLAARYYNRAVSSLRKRIAAATTGTAAAATGAGGPVTPRTILIMTLLFLVYEVMQSNTDAVDQLLSTLILALRDQLSGFALPGDNDTTTCSATAGAAAGSRRPGVAVASDDEGVSEIECFIPRMATLRAMRYASPVAVPRWVNGLRLRLGGGENEDRLGLGVDISSSLEEIIRSWDRSFPPILTWLLSTHCLAPSTTSPEGLATLAREQGVVLRHCARWEALMEQKMVRVTTTRAQQQKQQHEEQSDSHHGPPPPAPPSSTTPTSPLLSLWHLFHTAARTTTLVATAVLDPTKSTWDRLAPQLHHVFSITERIMTTRGSSSSSMPPSSSSSPSPPIVRRLLDHHVLPLVSFTAARCADPAVRRLALSIGASTVAGEAPCSWEAMTAQMTRQAVCDAEDGDGDGDGDGHGGGRGRRHYLVSSRWNTAYTELTVRTRRRKRGLGNERAWNSPGDGEVEQTEERDDDDEDQVTVVKSNFVGTGGSLGTWNSDGPEA